MEVNLSPESETFIRERLGVNGLTTPSEVIEQALRAYREMISENEEILRALEVSDEQLKQGNYIDLNGREELHAFFEGIKREGRRRLGLREDLAGG